MNRIPKEIIIDIFTRVPPKSIGRSRCVSKPWRCLLSEHNFIKAHVVRTCHSMDNELLMLISKSSNALYTAVVAHHLFDHEITVLATEFSFVMHPYFWVHGTPSCDGLMLLVDESNKRFLVNPTTKEYRELPFTSPNPYVTRTVYGIGYDHVIDDYKVLRLSCNVNDHMMYASLYSLSSGTWKQVEISPYHQTVVYNDSGVLVGGIIHWIMINPDHSTRVVGFDLVEEKFCEISPPSPREGVDYVYRRLMVLGGCLSIIHSSSRTEIDVWVMKEYGVQESWTKFSILDHGALKLRPFSCMSKKWEMMIKKNEEKLVMYNFESETFKDITIQGITDQFHMGGSFIETLVSPFYNHDTHR